MKSVQDRCRVKRRQTQGREGHGIRISHPLQARYRAAQRLAHRRQTDIDDRDIELDEREAEARCGCCPGEALRSPRAAYATILVPSARVCGAHSDVCRSGLPALVPFTVGPARPQDSIAASLAGRTCRSRG
jgi:hypothetical protein